MNARAQRGFSLIEVVVALAVASIFVVVLSAGSSIALKMTVEAERLTQATFLAEEVMNRALGVTEIYGFGEQDVSFRGDFDRLYPEEFANWRWRWSLKKTDIEIPDLGGLMDSAGIGDNEQDAAQQGTMAGLGIDSSIVSDMVGNYVRELRVHVCYPIGKDQEDCLELATHVVNPGGRVMGEEDQQILLDKMGSNSLPDIMEEGE